MKDIDKALKRYQVDEKHTVRMLDDPKEQALFYCMERLSEQYAIKFFSLLFGRDIGNVESNLPLVFVNKYDMIWEHLSGGEYVLGQNRASSAFEKNYIIRIVLPVRSERAYLHKSLKNTIRHELIHYYLYLHDLPYRDNDGLFWAYCFIYDAGAYMPMNETDKEKYDRFVDICEKYGDDASYNDLQTLAEAIMLDDGDKLAEFNMMIEWRKQLAATWNK